MYRVDLGSNIQAIVWELIDDGAELQRDGPADSGHHSDAKEDDQQGRQCSSGHTLEYPYWRGQNKSE
jgi:hypothetical protein